MNWNWLPGNPQRLIPLLRASHDSRKLRALIDQATSDSVDESDEHAGLLSMIREEVVCPFARESPAKTSSASASSGPKTATASMPFASPKDKTHVVDISMLEWIEPLPKGHEWIEAYFAWRNLLN